MRQKTKSQPNREKEIPTDWLYGLEPEEQDELKRVWRNSTYLLDKLKAIIERKATPLFLDRDLDYANPNWEWLRADKNGRLRAYEEISKLLP